MMMMKTACKTAAAILLCIGMTAGCKPADKSKDNGTPADTATAKPTDHMANYVRPEIPQMMTDPKDRAEYYVAHYWDAYSWADTAFVHSDETEQLYADFLGSLKYASPDRRHAALQSMMRTMETDSTAYAHFCFLNDKYLYDPNSPMRNEDYYISVLEQMLQSPRLTDTEKLRPVHRLKQARKNRPGMTATDFSYVTPSGKSARMSQLKADCLLLFFYDPDCTNCRESEHILSNIPFVLDMQQSGKLRILAVYTDDDRDEWLRKAPQMPKDWIVAWNKQGDIRSRQLYDIRATPPYICWTRIRG
ncbi:MAG: DUF5106 domain-containing protein [Bacteroides sp.]|nr:DUF5106 domain-containing protein [Bacteroides sp.]